MNNPTQIEYRKLRYRCRRGTRELETLLMGYLDNHYINADSEHQATFKWLLDMEDDVLWDWIHDSDEAIKMSVSDRLNLVINKHLS